MKTLPSFRDMTLNIWFYLRIFQVTYCTLVGYNE